MTDIESPQTITLRLALLCEQAWSDSFGISSIRNVIAGMGPRGMESRCLSVANSQIALQTILKNSPCGDSASDAASAFTQDAERGGSSNGQHDARFGGWLVHAAIGV